MMRAGAWIVPDERPLPADLEAFLDAGQRLIATKGYAQLSIQDVIDELSSSKGAFYHYFDSKAALLDGVADDPNAGIALVPELTAQEKREPTEHLLLREIGFVGDQLTYAIGKVLVVCHASDGTTRSAQSSRGRTSEPAATLVGSSSLPEIRQKLRHA